MSPWQFTVCSTFQWLALLLSSFFTLSAAAAEVVAWGDSTSGQTTVPSGLSNVVVVAAAGEDHSLALRADGTVVAWGYNGSGQTTVPLGLSNVVAVAGGAKYSLALTRRDALLFTLPRILMQPRGHTLFSGASLSLYAIAVGALPLRYQWQRNGEPLSRATNNLFTMDNVQPSDSGSFSVVVGNAFGSVTSAVALVVVTNSPPFIIQAPQSQTTYAGNSVTFSVTADGSRPLTYQWFLTSVPLAGATSAFLTVNNVQSNNVGTYTVSIANQYGMLMSLPVLLMCWRRPNGIHQQEQSC